jgi:hypothetical protein
MGRMTSVFLTQTDPIGGIWVPPRSEGPILRRRRWVWRDGEVHWTPAPPADAQGRLEVISRIVAAMEAGRDHAERRFLTLSGTSKTGRTWSLPAVASCPNIDETCSQCYALDGWYRTSISAQLGRVLRLEYLRGLIATGNLGEWVEWMLAQLKKLRPVEVLPEQHSDKELLSHLRLHGLSNRPVPYFRWHDSGDVFHREYAEAIIKICQETPGVAHWLPTRMAGLFLSLVQSKHQLPANLAIQVSCHRGGMLESIQHGAVREIRRLQPSARVGVTYTYKGCVNRTVDMESVHEGFGPSASVCPATIAKAREDRVCTGCRRCWSSAEPGMPIVYAVHRAD